MHIAIIITTIAALSSAVATVWLATATRKLATGTESLVKTTKAQGEQSAAANQSHDDLLRDTFLVENRRKIYRDLKYYLTIWRQHFENLDEYFKEVIAKEGSLSMLALGQIQKLITTWPLNESFDPVRMGVELELEDDNELVELFTKWEIVQSEIQSYLETLKNSIVKEFSNMITLGVAVDGVNPFNKKSEQFPDEPNLIPSDSNVAYVLRSVEPIRKRLQDFEDQIADVMKRKLDIHQRHK